MKREFQKSRDGKLRTTLSVRIRLSQEEIAEIDESRRFFADPDGQSDISLSRYLSILLKRKIEEETAELAT